MSKAEVIGAKSDDEARDIAGRMVNGHGVDLWERARFLASYPPLTEQGAIAATKMSDDA